MVWLVARSVVIVTQIDISNGRTETDENRNSSRP